LAIYIGYIDYKIIGATLAGLAFVLPSFVMVVAIGYAYVEFWWPAWMQAVFYGVGARRNRYHCHQAVISLLKKTIGRKLVLWINICCTCRRYILTESENIWLILGAGFAVWFVKRRRNF